jgi:hypothetical protein
MGSQPVVLLQCAFLESFSAEWGLPLEWEVFASCASMSLDREKYLFSINILGGFYEYT